MAATKHMQKTATRVGHRPLETISLRQLFDHRYFRLALLVVAGGMLILSIFLPYWHITLYAPQYPKGLTVDAYVTHLTGDVREVDGLNHYIGMIKLSNAAPFERTISRFAIPVIALLAIASFWIRDRWKWLAVIPVLMYPLAFIIDLFAWLYYAGHSLDPHAALSRSINPFTPHILGIGRIGQFHTDATFAIGFYFALIAAVLAFVAVFLERKREREAD